MFTRKSCFIAFSESSELKVGQIWGKSGAKSGSKEKWGQRKSP